MKGLVKFGPGKEGMGIRQIPDPSPHKGFLKAKVQAAGICGSDIHIMRDEIPVQEVVMGHEYVGTVVEIGEGVDGWSKGDWVVSQTPYDTCGECYYCRSGDIMFCPERRTIGFHVNGAMAEYIIINSANAFHVPDNVEDKISVAALEPFSCGARAAGEKSTIRPGDTVVISGPGMLGLAALQIAKLRGAYVIVFGLPKDSHRLEIAKQLGADDVETDSVQLTKKVLKRNPCGADVAFESSGAEASMDMCIDLVRKNGYLGQLSVYGKKISVNMDKLLDNEIHLTNNFGAHRSTWLMTLGLLRDGKISLSELTQTRFPLDRWSKAFDLAAAGGAFKVLLLP